MVSIDPPTPKTETLDDLVKDYTDDLQINRLNINGIINGHPHLVQSFMVSLMLSNYVRYKPIEWATIQQGVDSSIIMNIRRFRKLIFPR